MSDTVISVENLSKRYLVGHEGPRERYHALRDTLVRHGKNFTRKALDMMRGRQIVQGDEIEEFWALKDVSFEVKRGEVLGIIGRNGAGKSTLLKILSRITEPTEGRVTLRGRVASLLEVGTGFHPELTGRENIFLNGAILGMARAEIKWKFDEIVDFAGVEKFLDTPVKRYSSGMYVRLAFAVAAHLEPEILVIDEVLAVGDAEFQKKCLGKMQDVAKGGRTVLFVSHQLQTLRQLCKEGILLHSGTISHIGTIHSCIGCYLGDAINDCRKIQFEKESNRPCIVGVSIDRTKARRGDIDISIDYVSPFSDFAPVPGVVLTSSSGDPVYGSNLRMHPTVEKLKGGLCGTIHFKCHKMPLLPGRYRVSVWLGEWHQDHDQKIDALEFSFKEDTSPSLSPPSSVIGYIDAIPNWSIE